MSTGLNDTTAGLRDRIEKREARLGILGLGYVGLPLALEFAKAGFTVLGFDISEEKVDLVNKGSSYIGDVTTDELAEQVNAGRIAATTDFDRLADMDCISICVPTPLSKTKDPDMTYVEAATNAIAERMHPDILVILESTTYPGTTEELILPLLAGSERKVGEDFFLAFSPERVDPGNPVYQVKNTPKVVGGTTPACTELASLLYAQAIDHVHPVTSTGAAEMVKLLENTYRSVNIGLVNEIAIMAEKLKLDVWEVIEAAATKPFGFMPFYPGPGLGGHCIPIDPLYLSWKLRTLNYKARFIELASEINTAMPDVVVDRVAHALNQRKKAVNGSRILMVGIAYKKDIDDVRESPALDVLRLLQSLGANVRYHDPFVPELSRHGVPANGNNQSVPLTDEEIRAADCVVITTAHSDIDFERVVEHACLVFDTRNATGSLGKRANVVKL